MNLKKAKKGDIIKIKNREPIKITANGNGAIKYVQKRKKGIMILNIFDNKYYDMLSNGKIKIISPIVKKLEVVK